MDNPIPSAETKTAESPARKGTWLFNKPGAPARGAVGWITTTDHKKIGVLYSLAALLFLVIGGVEAILIRAQLAHPGSNIVTAREYSQLFTMHGTTMLFLAVIPMGTAFFNFIVPLQTGARNVAFPRINALSFWCFMMGAIILNSSWFLPGGAPTSGWNSLVPPSSKPILGSLGLGRSCWVVGLQLLTLSTLLTSINFLTSIINMRCKGMTMMRLPIFSWMALLTSALFLLAFPLISTALTGLLLDLHFGTLFYNDAAGGDAFLWQHFFWIRGYPEVYILLLPAIGIISEILATFSRKPLVGYRMTIFSAATLGFLAFASWGHHMANFQTVGIASQAFQIITTLAAIPPGILAANWIATLCGGENRFKTPLLFAVGFLILFILGSLTGMIATVTSGSQLQNTYFTVANIHYLLVGGSIFGLLAGFYYWIPKLTGAMMDEVFGKICFILIFVGFIITFLPMQYLGLDGMPHRIHTYHTGIGWDAPNKLSSFGAFILGFGILFSVIQILYTLANKKNLPKAGDDPWDARTLEWTTPSPIPPYNFHDTPIVQCRDQCWGNKHHGEAIHLAHNPDAPTGIQVPGHSWWPALTGLAILILCLGLIIRGLVIPLPGIGIWEPKFEGLLAGFVLTLVCLVSWAMEPQAVHHLSQEEQLDLKDSHPQPDVPQKGKQP